MNRDIYTAISDPVRRDIIDLLSNEVLTVNDVAENFDISRPAVSKHLKILQECGLIEITQKGRERHCELISQNLIPAFMWLEKHKGIWEQRVDAFEDYLSRMNTENKKDE